ncbi:MAG TPA: hypothetical protein VF678_14620, partial [bacterium]
GELAVRLPALTMEHHAPESTPVKPTLVQKLTTTIGVNGKKESLRNVLEQDWKDIQSGAVMPVKAHVHSSNLS